MAPNRSPKVNNGLVLTGESLMRLRHAGSAKIVWSLAIWLANGLVAFGQQQSDPKFDARVAQPAYTDKHPRVLFDEGHFNVHTSQGGYKAFADLVVNDGCALKPGTKPFDAKTLADFDILVIANATVRPCVRKAGFHRRGMRCRAQLGPGRRRAVARHGPLPDGPCGRDALATLQCVDEQGHDQRSRQLPSGGRRSQHAAVQP